MTATVGDELIDTETNRGWGRKGWNVDAWGIGGRIKLEAGGYLEYVRAVKELGYTPIRIDEYKSLQGSMDMNDISN